jgi:hypothetical protein
MNTVPKSVKKNVLVDMKKNVLVDVKNQNRVAVILLPKPTFSIWVVIIRMTVTVVARVVVLGVTPVATQRVLL